MKGWGKGGDICGGSFRVKGGPSQPSGNKQDHLWGGLSEEGMRKKRVDYASNGTPSLGRVASYLVRVVHDRSSRKRSAAGDHKAAGSERKETTASPLRKVSS